MDDLDPPPRFFSTRSFGLPEPDPDDEFGGFEPDDLTDAELMVGVPIQPYTEAELRERAFRAQWDRVPDEPLPEPVWAEPGQVATVLRAVRWLTGTSQRELADAADLRHATVVALEREVEPADPAAGRDGAATPPDPRLSTVCRLLAAAGLRLAVVDAEGTQLMMPAGQTGFHDQGGRQLPAHLWSFDPRRPDIQRRAWWHQAWWGHSRTGGPDPRRPEPARVSRGRAHRAPRPITASGTTDQRPETRRAPDHPVPGSPTGAGE